MKNDDLRHLGSPHTLGMYKLSPGSTLYGCPWTSWCFVRCPNFHLWSVLATFTFSLFLSHQAGSFVTGMHLNSVLTSLYVRYVYVGVSTICNKDIRRLVYFFSWYLLFYVLHLHTGWIARTKAVYVRSQWHASSTCMHRHTHTHNPYARRLRCCWKFIGWSFKTKENKINNIKVGAMSIQMFATSYDNRTVSKFTNAFYTYIHSHQHGCILTVLLLAGSGLLEMHRWWLYRSLPPYLYCWIYFHSIGSNPGKVLTQSDSLKHIWNTSSKQKVIHCIFGYQRLKSGVLFRIEPSV